MIRSLRMRLFIGITLVSALALGVLSVGIDQAVHRMLESEFDDVLLEKARTLASMVEQSGAKTHFDYQPEQFPEFRAGPKAAYFEVYLDGQSKWHSDSLGEGHLPEAAGKEPREVESYTLPDGRTGRILAMPFTPLVETDDPAAGAPPNPLPRGLLVVAQDSSRLAHTLERLRLLLAGLGAAATLISGALLVWVAGRTIRPLQTLSRQIEGLRETDLSTTIKPADFPTELAPVVERLNGLLQRLEDAFTRERSFTADAAHELRTPLAGMLATLQVVRSRPREAGELAASIDKSLAILLQMQGLVENLLLLARAESGQLAVKRQSVALGELAQEGQAAFFETAAGRQLRFECSEEAVLAVAVDREMLRVVLYNLLDNAVSYAPAGSAIKVRVMSAEGKAVLEIANPCTTLKAEDLPGLFGRFVRKDESRSATGVHAGLGLSICQRLVGLLGGTVGLRLEGGELFARIELPMDGDAEAKQT